MRCGDGLIEQLAWSYTKRLDTGLASPCPTPFVYVLVNFTDVDEHLPSSV